VPIATAALLVSALVFAPLSSYLAGRRARSALIWFLLGIAIGPIAVFLLLVAPPGRCPDCGTRVRGWPRTCESCGAALGGAVDGAGSAARPGDRQADVPIVVRPVASVVSGSGAETIRPALAPMPRPGDSTLVADGDLQAGGPSWDVSTAAVLVSAPAAARAGRRRGRQRDDVVGPQARILGSGIFLGGSAPSATNVVRLSVGDRYGLARDGDELQILGPVNIDEERIVARLPIAGADVELTADRLVVQGGPAARGMVVAFAGLAFQRGIDVAAILRAPTDRAEA
jgi:hypothetical protein